jgi:RND family efflux transporter MFP subunit
VRRDEARVTLGRLSQLLKDGIVTQADVDAARANMDSAEARISLLRQQVLVSERQIDLQQTDLDNTIIRAPFTGVAISKDAQPGEMVSPVSAGGGFTRTGICTIVDMRSLEIEVDVNQTYINRVHPKQNVTAVLDAYQDWQIPGRVITIVPAADRQKATVLVRIAFEQLDPRILPDMGVKVTFLADPEPKTANAQAAPVTLAPKAALVTQGASTFAFVVRGDNVERRAVQTGGTDGDRIEVRAGLQPGDRVVLSPPSVLQDGGAISVKPR